MSADPHFMEYAGRGGTTAPTGRRRLRWRVMGWASIVLSAVLVAASLAAYAGYRRLYGNIRQENVGGQLGGNRPPKLNSALNFLMIGSDTRAGNNAKYGPRLTTQGARSDTIIMLHLSPGGDRALGVSFPRDSVVSIPACTKPDGTVVPPRLGQINESFNNGGAACTIKTVESLTRVRIDHFVQVDFSGFKNVVDALGGVEICLPRAVNDPKSKLRLPAGRHVVKGEQALAYVRVRYGFVDANGRTDGSDLGRIKRQQQFMGAVVRKATSTELLTDPGRLFGFLNAATRSITTDSELTPGVMARLAQSVKGMSAGKVRFVTVPTHPYPADPNRVQWTQPDAQQLFTSIRNDNEVRDPRKAGPAGTPGAPGGSASPGGAASPGAAGPPASGASGQPAVPAGQVRVRVLNGAGVTGLAQRAADQLRSRGFSVIEIGNAGFAAARSQVRYGSGAAGSAATLAALVPGATNAPGGAQPGAVDLVLGADWQGLRPPPAQRSGVPASAGGVTANQDPCKTP
jgi:LCP family protein required for cell wall assembly